MEELLYTIATSGQSYTLIALIFVLMFFVGEPVVLILAFLAATYNILTFTTIILITFLSAVAGELFWWYAGRTPLVRRIAETTILSKIANNIPRSLRTISEKSPLRLLLTARLFTGVTIAAILYLSQKKISTIQFIGYSIVVNAFWTPIVVSLGFAAGKGHKVALDTYQAVEYSLSIGLVILIVLYIIFKYTTHKWYQRKE